MLMLVGMVNPLGTRNPHEYGFGQNFIPFMGMRFLASVFFSRVWVWASNTQRVFIHCHLYSQRRRPRPARREPACGGDLSVLEVTCKCSVRVD
jgi:hypothetical protein